jgi:hypothetical protein
MNDLRTCRTVTPNFWDISGSPNLTVTPQGANARDFAVPNGGNPSLFLASPFGHNNNNCNGANAASCFDYAAAHKNGAGTDSTLLLDVTTARAWRCQISWPTAKASASRRRSIKAAMARPFVWRRTVPRSGAADLDHVACGSGGPGALPAPSQAFRKSPVAGATGRSTNI